MHTIDNHKFGKFISELRKEKGMTQKELADLLFVTDKAVSKWERGLSLPDISLLLPLKEIFEVSITELLNSERIEDSNSIPIEQSNQLLEKALSLKSKRIIFQNLFTQKEAIKATYIKCFAFSIFSVVLTFSFIQFMFWLFAEQPPYIYPIGPVLSNISYTLLSFNFFLLILFLYFTYKKSLCYLFFSSIYIISGYWLNDLLTLISTATDLNSVLLVLELIFNYFIISIIIGFFTALILLFVNKSRKN